MKWNYEKIYMMAILWASIIFFIAGWKRNLRKWDLSSATALFTVIGRKMEL
jgi:hypothetical protein